MAASPGGIRYRKRMEHKLDVVFYILGLALQRDHIEIGRAESAQKSRPVLPGDDTGTDDYWQYMVNNRVDYREKDLQLLCLIRTVNIAGMTLRIKNNSKNGMIVV